jgi:hypothetical protein
VLDVEHRLRRKLAEAAGTIGRGIDVVPRLTSPPEHPGTTRLGRAARRGELAERIARWARPQQSAHVGQRRDQRRAHSRAVVAAAESVDVGWLAALDDGRVIAALDHLPPDDGETAARAARSCDCPGRPLMPGEGEAQVAECQRWLDAERIAQECGRVAMPQELDDAIERRIAAALGRSPRHERPVIVDLGRRLRESLVAPRPLGEERALRALLDGADRVDDRAWLTQAVELASPGTRPSSRTTPPRIVALVALGPSGRGE